MASSGDYTVHGKIARWLQDRAPLASQARERNHHFGKLQGWHGRQVRRSKMMVFPAGSFAYLDPDMHHYAQVAMSSGETIIQIHGMSPVQFNYINPADDPSKK